MTTNDIGRIYRLYPLQQEEIAFETDQAVSCEGVGEERVAKEKDIFLTMGVFCFTVLAISVSVP